MASNVRVLHKNAHYTHANKEHQHANVLTSNVFLLVMSVTHVRILRVNEMLVSDKRLEALIGEKQLFVKRKIFFTMMLTYI